jgi:hypothetical protein
MNRELGGISTGTNILMHRMSHRMGPRTPMDLAAQARCRKMPVTAARCTKAAVACRPAIRQGGAEDRAEQGRAG